MSGSAPLLSSTFLPFKELTGLEIVNGIGSTESIGTQLASYLPGYKPGATGWPVPGVEAKVIDDEGNECEPGVTGRLVIKACYGTMYWRDVERQKAAVIDGWSLSGDYVYKDEDGLFWHVSRIDDIIKSRGYRVSPGEVEDALHEHQAVFESTVIGVPDPEQGQRVKAFVILKDGFAGSPELVEELKAYVKKRVAPYMAPSEIEFVDSLPRTETGKVRRIELRELEARRAAEREARGAGRGMSPVNVPAFAYLQAATLEEACELLAEHRTEAQGPCGGDGYPGQDEASQGGPLLPGEYQGHSRTRLHRVRTGRRSAFGAAHDHRIAQALPRSAQEIRCAASGGSVHGHGRHPQPGYPGGQHMQRLPVSRDRTRLDRVWVPRSGSSDRAENGLWRWRTSSRVPAARFWSPTR